MFEKEAEKYATQECCATCKNINHFCKEKCECWSFAKKGAEFGYIKAFVEADKNLKAIVTDFNKAKELIQDLVASLEVIDGEQIRELKVVKEAEQFLINIERYENGK